MEERNDMGCDDPQPICETKGSTKDCLGRECKGSINDLRVEQLSYGYTVRAGCQTFAIEKQEELIRLLTMYIQEPIRTKNLWYDGKLFV